MIKVADFSDTTTLAKLQFSYRAVSVGVEEPRPNACLVFLFIGFNRLSNWGVSRGDFSFLNCNTPKSFTKHFTGKCPGGSGILKV